MTIQGDVPLMNASPESCAALVLNADFRPLSYFPLSLWPWQESIKAVFLDRVNIVSQYERVVHSPSFEMKLPSVIALKQFIPLNRRPAFTRFNVFLRDSFTCQYSLLPHSRIDVRSRDPALARRTHDLEQRRHRLPKLQPDEGQPSASAIGNASPNETGPAFDIRVAGKWAGFPAQLFAPELARLSLLGYRTRSELGVRHRFHCRVSRPLPTRAAPDSWLNQCGQLY